MSVIMSTIKYFSCASFNTEITNFDKDTNHLIRSKEVLFGGGRWSICIDPGRRNEHVKVTLWKMDEGRARDTLFFEVAFLSADSILQKQSMSHDFMSVESKGWPKFIKRTDLLRQIPNKYFTVAVKMQMADDTVSFTTPEDLAVSEDLKIFEKIKTIANHHFHDIEIQVQGRSIMAHKFLLSAHSSVLYEKILDLNQSNVLRINDASFETLQETVNFMYGRKVKKNFKNILDLLKMAKAFKIHGLVEECQTFISQNALDGNQN